MSDLLKAKQGRNEGLREAHLRGKYETLFGSKPGANWKLDTIKNKIDEKVLELSKKQ